MVKFNPINFDIQNNDVKIPCKKDGGHGSIWAAFNDTDKIVDMNDVLYSSDNVNSKTIQNFLNRYSGKEYTKEIMNELNQLIQDFNNANNSKVEQFYDEKTEENAIRIFAYKKDGSSELKKQITNWPNGNIKECFEYVEKDLVKKTVYRKDGTKFSEELRRMTSDDTGRDSFAGYEYLNFLISKTKYNSDGTTPKVEINYDGDTDDYTEYRFDKGKIWSIIHFDKSMKKYRDHIVFGGDAIKQSSEMSIEYDENGQIICYDKYLQENSSDFNEEVLNGEIDIPPRQGALGTCYIATPVIALTLTNSGLNILNNTVDYDKKTGIGYVTFQGEGKEYQFTKEETSNAMTRLGYDEPDYVNIALGIEKLKLENNACVEGGNPEKVLESILPSDIKCHYLGGLWWYKKLVNETLDDLMNDMKEHDYVIITSSNDEENINDEWLEEKNVQKHYITMHMYAVKEITPDRIILIEPNTHSENEYTRDEFFLKFQDLIYAKLN